MTIMVHSVKPHHAETGMYQVEPEGVGYGEFDTVEQYITWVQKECPDLERAKEEEENADGRIYDQNDGLVLAWRDGRGCVSLEWVYAKKQRREAKAGGTGP